MSRVDRQRWDKKWAALSVEPFKPHPLLTGRADLLTGGEALDLACGLGQNAIWLAAHSYCALGVDLSRVALNKARREAARLGLSEQLQFRLVDLDRWQLPANSFDLICVFRFLNRRLFPAIREGLRPEGLLFYSTRHIGVLENKPATNPAYLLRRGELRAEFGEWQILHDYESQEEAELIARKR